MFVLRIIVPLILLVPFYASGQKIYKTDKHLVSLDIDLGHSFPSFKGDLEKWKGTFYPAGAITISFHKRICENWQTGIGLGITGYALVNQGPGEKYILDFDSPHLVTSIHYIKTNSRKHETILGLKSGVQLGYTDSFTETFDSYEVSVTRSDPLYFFLRPEIGIRNKLRKEINGFVLGYYLGVFYRYNFNKLGTAEFSGNDYATTAVPKGDIIGMFLNILIPSGKQKIQFKLKNKKRNREKTYRPRF